MTAAQTDVSQQPDIPAIVQELRELEGHRRNATKMQTRITNNTLAMIRRALGWQWDDDESERTKINKEAEKIRKAIEAGHSSSDSQTRIPASLAPFVIASAEARQPYDKLRDNCEKRMATLAAQLPAWEALKDIRGFSAKGLAAIVGEAGDLSNYPNHRHVWKRLGLAAYKGRACSSWRGAKDEKLSADEWTKAGYCPSRRSIIYAYIEEPLIRAKGEFKAVYDRRRAQTAETHPDWSKMHSANDARRVMSQQLIKRVWRVWNGVESTGS